MLHKTRGIVLRTINHRETSVICQIFTESFGLQSYIINGVKRNRAKIHINILQPLHLLDLVVYHKNTAGIQRVSEARQLPIFQSIPYDDKKRSLAIFITEVLQKCLKQQSADEPLFEYIYYAVSLLDNTSDVSPNFHLYFLLRLSKFMGFYPVLPTKENPAYFDLKDGVFCNFPPYHQFFLADKETQLWINLMSSSFTDIHSLQISLQDRRNLLNHILDYYALHIESFGNIKSHYILEEVFS
jgi:DNA repair protein RecO (recombination protein O)